MITLQAADERDNHHAVEDSVFAVALLVSAPARIASEISVGRSDDDPALVVFGTLKNIASFIAFDFSHLPQYLLVPGLAKPNSLWKGCRRNSLRVTPFSWTTLRQSVNAFDVATTLDTETRYAWICVEP